MSETIIEIHLICFSCHKEFDRTSKKPISEEKWKEIWTWLNEKEPKCEGCKKTQDEHNWRMVVTTPMIISDVVAPPVTLETLKQAVDKVKNERPRIERDHIYITFHDWKIVQEKTGYKKRFEICGACLEPLPSPDGAAHVCTGTNFNDV